MTPPPSTSAPAPSSSAPPVTTSLDVPAGSHCEPVSVWDAEWAALEGQLLDLVNGRRALGADCRKAGAYSPTAPLEMQRDLRCAARLHSMDMAEQNYFSDTSPDGVNEFGRMDQAGYTSCAGRAEDIARMPTPAEVLDELLGQDVPCGRLMAPESTQVGIGYFPGTDASGPRWTLDFGWGKGAACGT